MRQGYGVISSGQLLTNSGSNRSYCELSRVGLVWLVWIAEKEDDHISKITVLKKAVVYYEEGG